MSIIQNIKNIKIPGRYRLAKFITLCCIPICTMQLCLYFFLGQDSGLWVAINFIALLIGFWIPPITTGYGLFDDNTTK